MRNRQFTGYRKGQGYERCSDKQYDYIESLAKQCGFAHASQGIKAVLGANPVQGLNRRNASTVIDGLKAKLGE